MKATTLKALRLPVGMLVVFGILAIAVFIYSDRLNKANPPAAAQITYRLDSASGLDAVNARGQHFTIDALCVNGDKLDLRYHASGVSAIAFTDIGSNPLYRTQPPTLINVTSAGNVYRPYDGTIGGQQAVKTVQGEFIWTFTGKPPHHLDFAVVRLMGDTNATWTIHIDN